MTALTSIRYTNQLLVQYNINCSTNEYIFYHISSLDLQPPDCISDETPRLVQCHYKYKRNNKHNYCRCQDYILIERESKTGVEICGNLSSNSKHVLSSFEKSPLKITFRTSETEVFRGFFMSLFCLNPESCLEGNSEFKSYTLLCIHNTAMYICSFQSACTS